MKKLARLILCTIIFIMGLGGAAMAQQIEEVSVHDPSIIKDDSKYYVFGSHITTAVSNDLINWEYVARGYNTPGNVHFGNLSENLKGSFKWAGEDDGDCKGGFAVWAPDVYYNPKYLWSDGTRGAYMMYYSASSTYKRSCIGLAVSKKINGVYKYVDTVIYSGFTRERAKDENSTHNKQYINTNIDELIEKGRVSGYKDDWGIDDYNNITYPNAIDPCVYEDDKGRLYLTYGSWSGGIFALRINELTGLPIYPTFDAVTEDGRMVDRYFGTHIAGGKGWSGEGPFIWYDKETGYYYLQTSFDWLGTEGGYHIRMFRSENPLGPFVDMKGNSAVYGENHAEHGIKMFANYYWDDLSVPYTSGGHSSTLVDDDGQRYVFFHTRFKGTEYFQLRVHRMFMNEDGWPVIEPYRYKVNNEEEKDYSIHGVGTYEFINHGTEIAVGGDVKMPEVVTLAGDGSVTGSMSGTWETNGRYCTLNLDNVEYKGLFSTIENEKGKAVITFTAVGNDNTAIWGVQTQFEDAYPDVENPVMTINFTNGEGQVRFVTSTNGQNPKEDSSIIPEYKVITEDIRTVHLDGSFGIEIKDVDLSEDFSLSFMMKPEKISTYTPIVCASEDFTAKEDKWFSLTSFDNGNDAVIWSRNAERDYWMQAIKKGEYKMNEWQHVTLVFDSKYYGAFSDSIYCKLYIDGYHVLTGSVAKGALTKESKLYFGINPWDSCYEGYISQVKIFDKALSHGEVLELFYSK